MTGQGRVEMTQSITEKIKNHEQQSASNSLIPYLEEIESLVLSGYKLKNIAPYFGMENKQFYNALRWAKNKVISNPDKYSKTIHQSLNLCHQGNAGSTPSIIGDDKATESTQKAPLDKTQDITVNHEKEEVRKPDDQSQLSWKERVERSMKPSNYLHRFNLELEHK